MFVVKLLGCTVDCNSKVLVPNVKYYYIVHGKIQVHFGNNDVYRYIKVMYEKDYKFMLNMWSEFTVL